MLEFAISVTTLLLMKKLSPKEIKTIKELAVDAKQFDKLGYNKKSIIYDVLNGIEKLEDLIEQ